MRWNFWKQGGCVLEKLDCYNSGEDTSLACRPCSMRVVFSDPSDRVPLSPRPGQIHALASNSRHPPLVVGPTSCLTANYSFNCLFEVFLIYGIWKVSRSDQSSFIADVGNIGSCERDTHNGSPAKYTWAHWSHIVKKGTRANRPPAAGSSTQSCLAQPGPWNARCKCQ